MDKIIVLLRSNNDIDNIVPVLYKIGRDTEITVEMVLRDSRYLDDFRIRALDQWTNISVHLMVKGDTALRTNVSNRYDKSEQTQDEGPFELVKKLGRRAPTTVPEKTYHSIKKIIRSESADSATAMADAIFNTLVNDEEKVLFLFDYLPGRGSLYNKYREIIERAKEIGHVTIALPHGGGTVTNFLPRIDQLEEAISSSKFNTHDANVAEIGYKTYRRMSILDYVTAPNSYFKKRFDFFMSEKDIKMTGSARYCPEWIRILNEIVPTEREPPVDRTHRVVLFASRRVTYVSEREVRATIGLVSELPDTMVAIKNHPREEMISPSDISKNNVVVADEFRSQSLIEWGDIFLNTGTSVVLDCVMRRQPLLDLDYLHANKTPIATYLPEHTIGTYDELYKVLSDLLSRNSYDGFYSGSDMETFIDEVITGGHKNVLDRHLDVFNTIVKDK